jgi:hypothetical protein
VALVRMAKNRKWAMNVTVEADPPHRIAHSLYERRRDFKLEVREAGPADALIVADIGRRCPMVMGDTSVWFDRGARYFDFSRLLPDCTVGLASVDGVPTAVSCGAVGVVRVGGELKRTMVVSHLRVLPEHQPKGLWSAANSALNKYRDHIDGTQAYISVDNLAVLHGFQTTPNRWDQIVQRVEFDCAGLAEPRIGRPASPANVAARLNAFHGDEELYVPYTAESFADRVERSPDLYGWDNVWLTDGAMVGVWPAGIAMKTGLQSHAADRARAGGVATNLRVHRAGPDRPGGGCDRLGLLWLQIARRIGDELGAAARAAEMVLAAFVFSVMRRRRRIDRHPVDGVLHFVFGVDGIVLGVHQSLPRADLRGRTRRFHHPR